MKKKNFALGKESAGKCAERKSFHVVKICREMLRNKTKRMHEVKKPRGNCDERK